MMEYPLNLQSRLASLVIDHPTMLILAITGPVLLLVWRLWRFTLVPLLWPKEPKVLPYWIPVIGHTFEFMYHSQNLFTRGRSHFSSGEPYAITIAGQKMVIIQSTQEVATLWKQTAAFTFEPFVENIMRAFGINHRAVANMFHDDPAHLLLPNAQSSALLSIANPRGKSYFKMQSEWLKHQLLPNDNGNLKGLQHKYIQYLSESLVWEDLGHKKYVISDGPAEKVISLQWFTRVLLGECAMKAFFGSRLFEVSPEFLTHYWEFEDESWKVFFNYPQVLARLAHQYKDKALVDLIRFFELPDEEKSGLAWIFKTLNSELRSLGLEPRDRNSIIMMITWAINHNAHKISFWVFTHLLNDPALLDQVRQETAKALDADNSIDLELLLSDCPHLDAVWHEVLRIYNNAAVARKAVEDSTVSGKNVYRGDTVLGPFRQFHLDPEIFGVGAAGFDARRFLENKSLKHAKGYSPFGGGNTLCPGRFFARSEIYILVATVLQRLEISIVPGQQMPQVDLEVPSSSAMPATRDVEVRIRPGKANEKV